MFNVGDLIVYGTAGVCRVEEITRPNFNEFEDDPLYYVLQPLYQTGTIYAPVDNEKVFMRKVISPEEANRLIDQIPDIQSDVFRTTSIQQLSKHYQAVIDTHECVDLIKLTKSIHKKKEAVDKRNGRLGQIDKRYMKRAEDLLFGEIAAALNIDRDEVGDYIKNRIGGEEAVKH